MVIDQSPMTDWTRTTGTIHVQYMAGYRYAGSLENTSITTWGN